ncbi:MAG: hypothetical protein WKF40_07985 [Thermoleophilaceae bacterium]
MPRDRENDYTREAAADAARVRRGALRRLARARVELLVRPGARCRATSSTSWAWRRCRSAWPGRSWSNGEHAQGEFYVPLATAEGTLVASYNRGMRLLYEAGGVKTTIMDDRMQRAPVFIFESAREARDFGDWIDEHFDEIKRGGRGDHELGKAPGHRALQRRAHALHALQLHHGRRRRPEPHRQGHRGGLRVDRGQPRRRIERFFLEVELRHRQEDLAGEHAQHPRQAGDRRGHDPQRACSRASCARTPSSMYRARQVSNLGGFMSGVNNNGAHSANGITAMFIATGQDAANVAESSAAFVYAELRPNGDYYYSITIPSLIVATYGGGTGLATQRECLELLGCYGKGGVRKLTEIVAATVLCGEMSLGAAVVAEEWVDAHDRTAQQALGGAQRHRRWREHRPFPPRRRSPGARLRRRARRSKPSLTSSSADPVGEQAVDREPAGEVEVDVAGDVEGGHARAEVGAAQGALLGDQGRPRVSRAWRLGWGSPTVTVVPPRRVAA